MLLLIVTVLLFHLSTIRGAYHWKQSPAVFRFNVEDNGCGIASEDIHHIFKQFYRSRTSSDRQGAGLGLSLAKGIVEGQGGSISVESRPGEGSIFKINFLI